LAHDQNFMRLALDANNANSAKLVSDLTFRELMSMPLKSGSRPPLVIDVLRSACAISEKAKLVIEIKPGNQSAASALARLLIRHPDLCQAVAMIMSFDALTMHRLRADLSVVNAISPEKGSNLGMHQRVTSFDHFGTMHSLFGSHHRWNSLEGLQGNVGLSLSQTNLEAEPQTPGPEQQVNTGRRTIPKLMLLTVSDPPNIPCELQVDSRDFSRIDNWLTTSDSSLDGVYVQYEPRMKTPEGAAALRQLSEKYLVGVWAYSGEDPDTYETFEWLVREGGCTYVNTDLPNHFRKEVLVRATATDSEDIFQSTS